MKKIASLVTPGIVYMILAGGLMAGELMVDNLTVNKDAYFFGNVALKTTMPDPVLLLHFNGVDGATNFTDSSTQPKTITPVGNVQLDTAQQKMGSATALFDGSGDYFTSAACLDWNFGTNDFTIDGWINPAVSPRCMRLICGGAFDDVANNMWFFGFGNLWGGGNKMNFGFHNGAGVSEYSSITPISFTPGVWYHWAVVRSGGHIYCFWNGVRNIDGNIGTSVAINTGPSGLIIGGVRYPNAATVVDTVNGSMDEIRVAKGVAKWTSDFTPPTMEYTAGTYTNIALTNVILNVEGSVVIQGSLAGNGANLTNLPGGNLAAGSVTANQIAGNTITATQINTNSVLAGVNADKVDGLHAADFATAAQGVLANNSLQTGGNAAVQDLTAGGIISGNGAGIVNIQAAALPSSVVTNGGAATFSSVSAGNLALSSNITVSGSIQLVGAVPSDNLAGLVLSYDFAASNQPIADLSGNGNAGSASGAVWNAAGFTNGGCYTLSGTNQWIQTATNVASLSLTNQLTIVAWIKNSVCANYPMIVTKNPSGTAGTGVSGNYQFRINNTGVLAFGSQYSATAEEFVSGIRTVNDGNWHFVGVTVDAATKVVRLYIDGALDNQGVTVNKPLAFANTEPVRIGRRKDGYCFLGVIDEPRIYGRALGIDEMARLYQYFRQQPNAAVLTADRINQTGFLQTNIFYGSVGIGTNVATNALNVAGSVSATAFVGNGGQLTALNGGNINNASIAGAKLANNTITATQIYTNTVLAGVNADLVDGKHASDLATASQGARLDLLNSVLTLSNGVLVVAENFDSGWAGAPWSTFQTNINNPASGWIVNNVMITNAVTNQSAPYVAVLKEYSLTNAWIRSPLLSNGYSSITFGMRAVSNLSVTLALEASYDAGVTWTALANYTNVTTNLSWYTFVNAGGQSQMNSAQYLRLRKMTELTNNIGYRAWVDSISIATPVPHVVAKELQLENVGVQSINLNGQTVTNWAQVGGGGVGGSLLAANNLSDVPDKVAARDNMGLGSAATQSASSFATAAQGLAAVDAQTRVGALEANTATAAQGAKADTALQPGANAAVQNLTASGDVGIGTTTPAAKLHVAGNVRVDGAIAGDGADLTNIPGSAIVGGVTRADMTDYAMYAVTASAVMEGSQTAEDIAKGTNAWKWIQEIKSGESASDLSMGVFTQGQQ